MSAPSRLKQTEKTKNTRHPVSYAIGLRASYLPKLALVIAALGVSAIFLSGQFGQAAAASTSPQWCYNYYGYYDMSYYGYYGYYYGYPYYGYGYYSYPYNCYYGYNGYYYSYSYDYYYTKPTKYQLSVITDPADLGSVSGNGTYDQGTSATFSITQSTIQTSPNTRYVFSHWGGDYSGVGASGTITMNGARKVVAVYQLQHYLSVGVQPLSVAVPQGEGWYNAGNIATLNIASEMLGGEDGSRLVFQGWNVDGKTVQTGLSLTLKMDAPHYVSAQYKTQYYLNVVTDQGVAYGAGWYDAGSTADIYVSTPVSTNYGVSILFNGWHGDTESTSQSTSVLMDKPKTVIAAWRTDATILNLTIALGIIAAFLAGAGILAYVAMTRSRFHDQEVKKVPKKEQFKADSESSTPVKKKSVPLKKKTEEPAEDSDEPVS